jgi:D-3-phosphoglycerate dehydrogenase
VDALLVWRWKLQADSVLLLDRCRIEVRYGVGYEMVDIPALAEREIPFANTPDYGTEEVADTACAMILAAQRKIMGYDRACRTYRSGWQDNVLSPLGRTSEQALGIIGVGRIGTAVVNRMKAFGYRILGFDPYQPPGHEKAVGYVRTKSRKELLAQADIISCHCPLTAETKAMIDEDFLKGMKPGASLINTAREGLSRIWAVWSSP